VIRERVRIGNLRIEKKIAKVGKAASTGYGLRAAFPVKPPQGDASLFLYH